MPYLRRDRSRPVRTDAVVRARAVVRACAVVRTEKVNNSIDSKFIPNQII